MQHAVRNRATIRVADRTDVSGRVTADSREKQTMKPTIRRWLVLAIASLGLYLGLPVCGLAQNDQGQNAQGLDPFVGPWLVHATILTDTPDFVPLPFEFDALEANFEDGTVIATVIAGAPAHGALLGHKLCCLLLDHCLLYPSENRSHFCQPQPEGLRS